MNKKKERKKTMHPSATLVYGVLVVEEGDIDCAIPEGCEEYHYSDCGENYGGVVGIEESYRNADGACGIEKIDVPPVNFTWQGILVKFCEDNEIDQKGIGWYLIPSIG